MQTLLSRGRERSRKDWNGVVCEGGGRAGEALRNQVTGEQKYPTLRLCRHFLVLSALIAAAMSGAVGKCGCGVVAGNERGAGEMGMYCSHPSLTHPFARVHTQREREVWTERCGTMIISVQSSHVNHRQTMAMLKTCVWKPKFQKKWIFIQSSVGSGI